ncbi:MAG: hypothetical protein HY706_21265 [Candidatus Hydrogenedentes bacterium]|nr:hypothetical protein [Candidatus Hydrogenedentota bacterium]
MNNWWKKLSSRERNLAFATLVVAIASVLYFAVSWAWDTVRDLDARIDRLQQDVLNSVYEAALRYSVETAYVEIAAQHSSKWTQEEIHDRLRQEIYRLAQKNPPHPGSKEALAGTTNPQWLLEIRSLGEGKLEDSGRGYREYKIGFKTLPTDIQSVILYLSRLQQSPQLLRIDNLEIVRPVPETPGVIATIEVTRTVVDSAIEGVSETPTISPILAGAGNLSRNPGFEEWDRLQGKFPQWDSASCRLLEDTEHATEGSACVRVETAGDGAAFYQQQELVAGNVYELTMDITASAPMRLAVMNDREKAILPETQDIVGDGLPRQYYCELRVPGTPGTKASLRVPCIIMSQQGSVAYVDNVLLMERKN